VDLPLPEPASDAEAKLVADVEAHGWHCVLLADPPCAHTVGLWLTLQHPELLVEGEPLTGHALLSELVARIQAGERFLPGAAAGDLRFAAVEHPESEELLGWARWLHGRRGFQAVRVIRPG
jgi:hypothetical protein